MTLVARSGIVEEMLLVTLVSRQSENMPTIEMALSLDLNLENGTIEHQLTGIKSNKKPAVKTRLVSRQTSVSQIAHRGKIQS